MITLVSLLGAVLGAPTFLDSSAGFGFFRLIPDKHKNYKSILTKRQIRPHISTTYIYYLWKDTVEFNYTGLLCESGEMSHI